MKQYKTGDRVKVSNKERIASIYISSNLVLRKNINKWENKVLLIEGGRIITDDIHIENNIAYLLTDLEGNKVGFVYADGLEPYNEPQGITGQDIKDLERILSKVKELGISSSMVRGDKGENYNSIKILSSNTPLVEIKTTKVW